MSIREPIPDALKSPLPVYCDSKVVCGFGRGSSELGIPTANVPVDDSLDGLKVGVYFGWCKLLSVPLKKPELTKATNGDLVEFNYGSELTHEETEVLPMVMSIGWNPFFNNEKKAAEVHIIHKFANNFYGARIKFCILGYIRPELNYTTKGMYYHFDSSVSILIQLEALIADINKDIESAKEALERETYQSYADLL